MDLNFSASEVTIITAMLGVMGSVVVYVTRQMLAAKQETIDAKQDTITRQEKTIEKQDLVGERSIEETAKLRDTVRELQGVVKDQARNTEGLHAQMAELTRELIDRRPLINQILEEYWERRHPPQDDAGGRRREGR